MDMSVIMKTKGKEQGEHGGKESTCKLWVRDRVLPSKIFLKNYLSKFTFIHLFVEKNEGTYRTNFSAINLRN